MNTMNKNLETGTNEEEETILYSMEISPAQKSSQNCSKYIKLNHQTKVILKNHKSCLIQILKMRYNVILLNIYLTDDQIHNNTVIEM